MFPDGVQLCYNTQETIFKYQGGPVQIHNAIFNFHI